MEAYSSDNLTVVQRGLVAKKKILQIWNLFKSGGKKVTTFLMRSFSIFSSTQTFCILKFELAEFIQNAMKE